MKRGAKRPAIDTTDPDALRSKKSMEAPSPSPPDPHRAESSRQHVQALNTQFARWIQLQLQNHPYELWEDGVRDYLSHASHIMEKFNDVVEWLRTNAAKSGSISTLGSSNEQNNLVTASENHKGLSHAGINNGFAQASTSSSILSLQNSGSSFNGQGLAPSQSSSSSSLFSGQTSSSLFSGQSSSSLFSGQSSSSLFAGQSSSSLFAGQSSSLVFGGQSSSSLYSGQSSSSSYSGQSSGSVFGGQSSSPLFGGQSSSPLFGGQSSSSIFGRQSSSSLFGGQSTSSLFSGQSSSLLSNPQSSGLFPSSQSAGLFSTSQSVGFPPNSQSSGLFPGTQLSTPSKMEASDDVNEENEAEKPSSPSLKRSEEKGIVVVHEVKCKVYVKADDSAEKNWKDIGVGQLFIKCKEGINKATKESKPTIVIRNDVGRVLLNALIYPGIKMNIQKKSIASIFHTLGGGINNGAEGDNTDVAVARTYLFRLRTEEDATKLAAAIKEHAPSA